MLNNTSAYSANLNQHTYIALENVLRFLSYGKSLGIPVDGLLAFYNFDLRTRTKKPGFVPGHVWENIVIVGTEWCARIGDPLAGLNAAIGLGNSFLGLWGFIAEKSETLGKAIEVAAAYKKLHADTLNIEIQLHPGYLDIVVTPAFNHPDAQAHAADFYLLQLVRFIQQCTGEARGVIESVHFQHAPPKSSKLTAKFTDAFKCSTHFNSQDNRLRIFSSALSLPLVTADADLQATLEPKARDQLAAFDRAVENFETQARQHLRKLFSIKQASKESLAQSLGMSSRTLLRKLQATGTTYQSLAHDVRLELAKQYILQPALPMTFVAEQLSFKDPQSFSRWFTEQTGSSPSSYRYAGSLTYNK